MAGTYGGISQLQHSFKESLALSEAQSDNPIWEVVYRKAFHNYGSMCCVRSDGWAQRGGIDRVITLQSGKTLTVDEKVRYQDYGDILLEYWSSEESQTPGWVAKDLSCDFISYAVIPTNKCYLIPFLSLRKAWRDNGKVWVSKYKRIAAKNNGYTTVSVGVPVAVLFDAINKAMTIDFSESAI